MRQRTRGLLAASLAALFTFAAAAAAPGWAAKPPDRVPPQRPRDLAVTGATATSISLAWSASRDNRDKAVVSYGVYRDGTLDATPSAPAATLSNLRCGTSYRIEVDAVDSTGNRSDRASIGAATVACPPVPAADRFVAPDGWDGSWSHVAATYDGAALRLYVNGVQVAQRSVSGPLDVGDGPLRIGGNSIWSEWFQGIIDDVRVYDRPVDATQIQHDMTSPVAPATGLVAGYPFDEGTGTIAHDVSGNHNDGTIDGAAWTARARSGRALAFDGTDDSVTIADAPSLDLSTGMTLEAWVDADRLDQWNTVVFKEQPGNAIYALYANTDANAPSGNVVVGGTETVAAGATQLPLSACPRAAPCRTFDRAYRAAKPGQVVELAPGAYPQQTIGRDASKTSSDDVVFRPTPAGGVTVSGLDVSGSHLTFAGFAVEGDWATHQETADVTFRNLVVHGAIFVSSSSDISVIGGSVGGTVDSKSQFGAWPDDTHSRNILVDGVTFHDVTRSNDGEHVECLLVGGGDGITIRNSRFRNCDVFDVSLGEMNGSGPPTNLTIENNFFGTANGFFSLQFNSNTSSLANVLIRNNSATQEMSIGDVPSLSNVRVVGNVAPLVAWHCDTRIDYSHNVWQGGTCGPTDVNAPAGFVDGPNLDLHLAPGAAAIDRGDPLSFPADDIDGQRRPLGKAPDAGADESR